MFNLALLNNLSSINSSCQAFPNRLANLSTDSRSAGADDLFVAIKGDKYDAADFITSVLNQGVQYIVFADNENNQRRLVDWKKQSPSAVFIAVKSVEQFLAELSLKRIEEWKKNGGMVIGITGSNGKTTHKEMLTHILNQLMPAQVHATKGNLNNHLGVPFTILQLEDQHRVAIIEMGTNHPGEIAPLCDMALPDAGLITNIGDSHLEFFKNRQGVFNDKRSLYDSIAKRDHQLKRFVHICSDPLLSTLPRASWVKSFGECDRADYKVTASASSLRIFNQDVTIPEMVGKHNYLNLACCIILAAELWGKNEQLIEAAKSFKPRANRSQVLEIGNKKFYLDAYNANPSSMCAALSALMESKIFEPQQTLFILGDMNELGESAEALHKQVGAFCKELGIVHVAFVGRYRQFYAAGWGQEAKFYASTSELMENWPGLRLQFTNFFIKGSRTLQLESLTAIT